MITVLSPKRESKLFGIRDPLKDCIRNCNRGLNEERAKTDARKPILIIIDASCIPLDVETSLLVLANQTSIEVLQNEAESMSLKRAKYRINWVK